MTLNINSSTMPSVVRSIYFKVLSKSISQSVVACAMKNHYESLGVPRNASQSDIKAAYYKLSLRCHPDRNDSEEASETFRCITEAYEIIGNFKLRKMYDRGLLGNVSPQEGIRKTYSNYNPTSSYYRNKPTHHTRESVYNFDAWSQFHYGDVFAKRNEARLRYEEKTNSSNSHKGHARNENVIFAIFTLTLAAFIGTYSFRDSLDEPRSIVKKE